MSNVFSCTATVARDAEVRYTPAGLAVLSVSVANNIGFGDKQQTLWLRVSLFGKRAEGTLQNYLKKGQQVFVSGELSQNEYQANDGTTRTSLELNANIIELVGKRSESSASVAAPSEPRSRAGAKPKQSSAPQSPDNFAEPYDDDIPF